MGLTYHFTFSAPGTTSAAELEEFLRSIEPGVLGLKFDPVLILNERFNTKKRREFARLLTTGHLLQSDKLKGVVVLRDGQVWSHDPVHGECRIIPKQGVVMIVKGELGVETVFGFLKYPAALKDLNGHDIVDTGIGNRWIYRNFVNSPGARLRRIVKDFADAGYVESERDEFAGSKGM